MMHPISEELQCYLRRRVLKRGMVVVRKELDMLDEQTVLRAACGVPVRRHDRIEARILEVKRGEEEK